MDCLNRGPVFILSGSLLLNFLY